MQQDFDKQKISDDTTNSANKTKKSLRIGAKTVGPKVFQFQSHQDINNTFSTDVQTPKQELSISQNGKISVFNMMESTFSAPRMYSEQRGQQKERSDSNGNYIDFMDMNKKQNMINSNKNIDHGLSQFSNQFCDDSLMQVIEGIGNMNLQTEQTQTNNILPPNLRLSIPQTQTQDFYLIQQQQDLDFQFKQLVVLKQMWEQQPSSPVKQLLSQQQQKFINHLQAFQLLLSQRQSSPILSQRQSSPNLSQQQFSPTLSSQQQFSAGFNPYYPNFSTSDGVIDQTMDYINDDVSLGAKFDDIWGNQNISKELQKLVEYGTEDQKDFIIGKLERVSPQIQRDVFGNYLVQKVFEKCNDKQRTRLFNKLKGFFIDLSKNAYGCRVIQKIIDFISHKEDLQEIFINEIKDNIRSLILDNNGNYVLHKMMETLSKEKVKFFLTEIESQVNILVQRNYGCKILLLSFSIYEQEETFVIQQLVGQYLNILAETEPGNYILQYLIRRGTLEGKIQVKKFILNQFVTLSENKYASNTVEKLLEVMDKDELYILSKSLMFMNQRYGTITFIHLSVHQYGSFVMKTLLVQSDKEALKPIQLFFNQNPTLIMNLSMNIYGQRIYQVLSKQNLSSM